MRALPPSDLPRLRLTDRGRGLVAVGVVVSVVGGLALTRAATTDPSAIQEPAGAVPAPSAAATESPPAPAWEPPDVARAARTPSLAADPAGATHAAARALFNQAPVVVVAPLPVGDRPEGRDLLARWLALRLQAPLVAPSPALPALIEALGVRHAVGVTLTADDDALLRSLVDDVRTAHPVERDVRILPDDHDLAPEPASVEAAAAGGDLAALRESNAPPVHAWLREVDGLLAGARTATRHVPSGTVVLVQASDPAAGPIRATAITAGVVPVVAASPDPRVDGHVVDAVAAADRILRAGSAEAWAGTDTATFRWQLATARTGVQLPGGGQTLFPGTLLVALYGHPDGGALGVLGEQPVDAAIERAVEHAERYAPLAEEVVVPTFEIIATVASAGPDVRGDYSRRTPISTLRPWVDAARAAGVYVVLDLQPGRTSFLDQAQEYEELLREPHVGLALDPEWRLQPDQVHLRQIGSVGAAEVNAVADWLAALVRRHRLPQKAFVLHQFKLSMLADRASLSLGHPELAPIIHVDGQGGQAAKDATYRAVTTLDPPPHVWWGWKNFYDEDAPAIRSPEATYAVEPRPVMISYQ